MVNGIRANQVPAARDGLAELRPGRPARPGYRPAGSPAGFSLVELLIVITVLAVLVMMAVPALSVLAPHFMVRSSAESLESLMQRARLTAANTQKPIRLALDCRNSGQRDIRFSTCTMLLYSANFDSAGHLDVANASRPPWTEIAGTRREIQRRVTVSLADNSGGRLAPQPVYTELSDSGGYVYWMVFLPTGRLIDSTGQILASHSPMRLVFKSRSGGVRPRELSLNFFTGRVSLRFL